MQKKKTPKKRFRRLVFIGALVAVLAVFLYVFARAKMAQLPQIISAAAGDSINGRLEIGSVGVSIFGSVVLSDVTVYGSDSGGIPILKAPSVSVSCSPLLFALKRDDAAASISRVDVDSPQIYLHANKNGRWNTAGILKQAKEGSPPVTPTINISSASITVVDEFSIPGEKYRNSLDGVDGVVNIEKGGKISFRAVGEGEPGRVKKITASGEYSSGYFHVIDVDAKGMDAVYWASYPRPLGAKVSAGELDGRVILTKTGKKEPFVISGHARLRGGMMQWEALPVPVDDLNVDVSVEKGKAEYKLDGVFAGSVFAASGVFPDVTHPTLDVEFASDRINFRRLAQIPEMRGYAKGLTLPESGKLSVRATGPLSSPVVDFSVSMPGLSAGGYDLRRVAASGTYSSGSVRVKRASASMLGGGVSASGSVKVSKRPSADIRGKASGLNLGDVPALREAGVSVSTSGDFRVSWGPRKLSVGYDGSLSGGDFKGVRFEGTAAGEYADGAVRVDRFAADVLGGTLTADGEVSGSGEIGVNVAGSGLNVSALPDELRKGVKGGLVNFDGRVTGSLKSPAFAGRVSVRDAEAEDLKVPSIEAEVSGGRESISVKSLVISGLTGEIDIYGGVKDPFGRAASLDLRADVKNIDVESAVKMFGGKSPVKGSFSGEFAVSGPAAGPTAEGLFEVENAVFHELSLDRFDGELSLRDGTLDIGHIDLGYDKSTVIVTGRVLKSGAIDVDVRGYRLPFYRLAESIRPYAMVYGEVNVDGRVTGTTKDPRVEAAFLSDGPLIDGRRFKSMNGSVTWDRASGVSSDLVLMGSDCKFSIPSLKYDPVKKVLSVTAEVDDSNIREMISMLDASPFSRAASPSMRRLKSILKRMPKEMEGGVKAGMDGTFCLAGGECVPDMDVSVKVSDVTYSTGLIDFMNLEGTWKGDEIVLKKLEAKGGDTSFFASGEYGPGDRLFVNMNAKYLSMDSIKYLIDIPDNFSGRADVTLVAEGNASSPSAQATIEIKDPRYGKIAFDKMRGRFSTGPDRLNIEEIALVSGGRTFSASGYVPMDWRSFEVKRDAPHMIESNFNSDSLEIISALSGIELGNGQGGSFKGSFRRDGTLSDPNIEGSIVWANGTADVPGIESELKDINVAMRLSGDDISVERFEGASSEGGDFRVGGRVSLGDIKNPELDLEASTNNLRLTSHNLSGVYGETVKALMNGRATFKGGLRKPVISGDVDIPSAVVTTSGPKTEKPPVEEYFVDPTFDLRVVLGKDVEYKSGRFRTPLVGTLTIGKTLSDPVVSGVLDIGGGVMYFPVHDLRILPGSTLTVDVQKGRKSAVVVDIQAETTVTATSVSGQRNKYKIFVVAYGSLDNLKTSFSSSPPGLSEERIMVLLTGQPELEMILGSNTGNLGSGLSDVISATMMPTVLAPIEEALTEAFGLEEFSLQTSYREPIRITLGERLLDGLYLNYSTYLGERPDTEYSQYEIQLSYRFKEGVEIGIKTDDEGDLGAVVQGRLRF